jgi:photosystem II stability/assembly factor-like uncharacterized protein
MTSTYYLTPNNQNNDGTYTGLAYVFDTSGGFSIDQSFPQINLNTYSPIAQYDVTEAIQVRFSVRTLNNKIGIIKDQNNDKVLQALHYDVSAETLTDDFGNLTNSVSINSSEFLTGVNVSNIISMGKMSTLYSDFNYTVMEYFGAPYGFSSVFSNATDFNANDGIFDAPAFINLINGITFDGTNGTVITDLSGQFTVNDLIKHLRFICGTNVFGNRPPSGNYGIPNGFMAGDLLYIPNGISITLSVAVEPEPYSPPDNVGPTNLNGVDSMVNWSEPQENIHKVTTSTISDITQTYSVPILIILDNEDTFNLENFGGQWNDVGTPLNLGNKYWLSVSISALGAYQSAVDEQGDIYISSDYGTTWSLVHNIGYSPNISNDFGSTWTNVFNVGSSNIFVSVSLCGKHQTVLSCGDSVYTSQNYGATWTRLNDENSDLYNSIETFPTGGISLSFTGQYQCIACETIWISTDYGQHWKDAFDGQYFNDHNWEGISISSTGQIQSAIDSGGGIYVSHDFGSTWTFVDSSNMVNKEWQSISISADANFQTAIEIGGAIYVSLDFGATWAISSDINTHNRNWQSISVSANGQYQTVVEYGGSIYTSTLL